MRPPHELLTRRLRVLVVQPFGELGGAELWLLRLLDATDRLDVEVLLLREGPLRAELSARGICVDVIDVGRTGPAVARGAVRLSRALRRSPADVVLTNGVKAQAVAGAAARAVGIPVVWVKHDHRFDASLTPVLAALATSVIATSAALVKSTRRHDVVIISPSPPPLPPLAPEAARDRLLAFDLDPELPILAMLTRLTPYKGVDTAIRALASDGGENWQLVCLGGDDPAEPGESRRLTRLADELGVRRRLHLVGHHPNAARLLSGCDALAVLTRDGGSRTPGREGFGMAAMEAMLAGVPVIAPDDGGDVSRRVAGGAGVLVNVNHPDQVAAALRQLEDPLTRGRMGGVAKQRSTWLFEDASTSAARLVRTLTTAAHRPGAGIVAGPPITVVSPVLNEIEMLDRLVVPLVTQLRPGDELLLVDSGSVDGTRQAIRAWTERDDRVRLIEVEPCSIGASRNHGVRAARNTVLACTDAGCEVDSQWLDRMRAAAAEPAGPELVVGTYRVHASPGRLFEVALAAAAWPDPLELHRASLPWQLWHRTIGPHFTPHRVDTRSVSFSRAAFEAAGGFREDLLTAEDEAFGRDVRAAGGAVELLEDATVTWFQRESVALAFRQFRGYGRGGGHSRSWRLLRIEGIRAVGYAAVVLALAQGGPAVRAGAGGAVAFAVGFPAARVVRRRQPLMAVALIPVAQLVKDAGKLVGTVEAVVLGRTGPLPRRIRSQS